MLGGNDQRNEGDDADAAHPGRCDAPKLQAIGQGLNVVEDGGTCGGEARHTLEKGVDGRELTAENQKRYRPENASGNPASRDDAKAFFGAHVFLRFCGDDGKKSAEKSDHSGENQRVKAVVHVVSESDERR